MAMALLPLAGIIACGGETGGGGSGGGGAGGNSSYESNVTCVDPGVPPAEPLQSDGAVSVSTLERCIYNETAQTLDVQLTGGEAKALSLYVAISGFSGKGTYKTTGDDTTYVSIRAKNLDPNDPGFLDMGSQGGDPANGDCPAHECTVDVTDASVTSAAVDATGRLTLHVSCPQLGNAGVGCVECTLAKPAFTIDVASCSHVE